MDTNLKGFDEIKKLNVEEKKVATDLNILNGHQFVVKDFPEPEYLLKNK